MSMDARRQRLLALMDRLSLGAILLQSPANFAWYTGGADNRVNLSAPLGAAGVLVAGDTPYVVTSNIEAPRMREEETPEIEVVEFPWHEGPQAVLREMTADAPLGADFAAEGVVDISTEISPLRRVLDSEAIHKYRRVGGQTAEAMKEAASSLRPGMDEHEAAASLIYSCRRRGLSTPVVLAAANDCIARYRHPVPRGAGFDRRVMLVVVAEQHGLHASLTRFVDFEEPDEESKQRQKACDTILIRMREEATRPGRSLAEAFADCQRFYAEEGFPDEWKSHHQGGIAGYSPREVIASADTRQEIEAGQTFAWNPSITGAKAEETFILAESGPEVITWSSDS